jgi:hypothetical protein
VGPCRRSCWARQEVRGPVVLASKCRSGTLTRKRSLVQIQYGPPGKRYKIEQIEQTLGAIPGANCYASSCAFAITADDVRSHRTWPCLAESCRPAWQTRLNETSQVVASGG